MEDGCTGPFTVQIHTTAEEHSPQRGREDRFPTGQGSFHCEQLCFIFASVNCCSSGFMLVNEFDQGLINQSAEPKIAPGSCWEQGIPSPPVRTEQEGILSAPAGCQPCAETAVGCWGDLSSDTFIWKNYCGCLQTSLQRASARRFPVTRVGEITEPAAGCDRRCALLCGQSSRDCLRPQMISDRFRVSHGRSWMELQREPRAAVSRSSRTAW